MKFDWKKIALRPLYMEKSCPGHEDNLFPPPSPPPIRRINFSERLYEKNVDPFAQVKSWLRML